MRWNDIYKQDIILGKIEKLEQYDVINSLYFAPLQILDMNAL